MSKSRTRGTTSRKTGSFPMPEDWLARLRQPPPHPGVVFREQFRELQEPAISTRATAARLGISNNRLNEIELGKRSVTAETALLLEEVTGFSAESWCRMQMHFDLWHAMQAAKKRKPLIPGPPFPTKASTALA